MRLPITVPLISFSSSASKGISALQIHRVIGSGSYRTARFMCHWLRASMHDPDFQQLMGIVEVDEVYVGGKNKNRQGSKRIPNASGVQGLSCKQEVSAALSRGVPILV
jgi:hypothetical protein